jgi:methyltransferase-like protein/cyclopropane fatty-acyl-phospholipid synthase-like methyltransferase
MSAPLPMLPSRLLSDGETSYDELPYFSQPFPQLHPNRLAVVAKLFGIETAKPNNCRLLELGHGRGENLVALAYCLPKSQFVGVELSRRQNEDAIKSARALGLTNVDLRHASIMDVDDSFGEFDFVICHGVFSWIPREVQEKIFEICNRRLRPNGVALISYNVFPGWRMTSMFRDLMRYHTGQFSDKLTRVQQARAILDFVAKQCQNDQTPYGLGLQKLVGTLSQLSDSYLYHEHLDEFNEPMYFRDFLQRVSNHNLEYLGDVEFFTMLPTAFSPEAQSTLRTIAPEQVNLEQYLDFLLNRSFRQSLVVRRGVPINRNIHLRVIEEMSVASSIRPVEPIVSIGDPSVAQQYVGSHGASFSTAEPILKAAHALLARIFPEPLTFAQLIEQTQKVLADSGGDVSRFEHQGSHMLRTHLMQVYCTRNDCVRFYVEPPPLVRAVSERPQASPLARAQAAESAHVCNQLLERVTLDDFSRTLISMLDGHKTVPELVDAIVETVRSGRMNMARDGVPITDPADVRQIIESAIGKQLETFGQAGLLIA